MAGEFFIFVMQQITILLLANKHCPQQRMTQRRANLELNPAFVAAGGITDYYWYHEGCSHWWRGIALEQAVSDDKNTFPLLTACIFTEKNALSNRKKHAAGLLAYDPVPSPATIFL